MLTDAELEGMQEDAELAQPVFVSLLRKIRVKNQQGGFTTSEEAVASATGRLGPANPNWTAEPLIAERLSGRVAVFWTVPVPTRWIWLDTIAEADREIRSTDKLESDDVTFEILAVPPRSYHITLRLTCARNA